METKKIGIIGTGHSSFAVADQLIKKGIKPTIVDIGTNYGGNVKVNEINKIPRNSWGRECFSSFNAIANNPTELLESFGFGGLSRVWGGAISKPLNEDVKDWNLDVSTLNDYFKDLDSILTQIGSNDEFSKKYNLKNLDSEIKYNKKRLKTLGVSRILVNSENRKTAFNTQSFFQSKIKSEKIDYLQNKKVIKIEEYNSGIKCFTSTDELKFDRIFLATGVLSTAKIMLNSIVGLDEINIKENKLIVSVWKKKGKCDNLENFNNGRFASYFFKESKIYNQIYFLNEEILKEIFYPYLSNSFLIKIFKKIFKNYIVFFSYLPDYQSNSITLVKNHDNFYIIENKVKDNDLFDNEVELIKKNFNNLELIKVFKNKNFGYGYHIGSSLPMTRKNNLLNRTDEQGRPLGFNKLNIVDSSILPNLPTIPHVYTVMANAKRIVMQSFHG